MPLRRPREGIPFAFCDLRRAFSLNVCAYKQSHVNKSWFVLGVKGEERPMPYRERRLSGVRLSASRVYMKHQE